MNIPTNSGIVLIKTLNLFLGGLITYYAATAYRRTGSTLLGAFAIGFAFIAIGAFIAGVLDLLLAIPIAVALIIESVFMMGGFLAILCSLYV